MVTHDIDEALLVADRVLLLAGAPAGLVQQWQISTAQPRDAFGAEFVALRVQVLSALRHAMHKAPVMHRAPETWVSPPSLMPQRSLAHVR